MSAQVFPTRITTTAVAVIVRAASAGPRAAWRPAAAGWVCFFRLQGFFSQPTSVLLFRNQRRKPGAFFATIAVHGTYFTETFIFISPGMYDVIYGMAIFIV